MTLVQCKKHRALPNLAVRDSGLHPGIPHDVERSLGVSQSLALRRGYMCAAGVCVQASVLPVVCGTLSRYFNFLLGLHEAVVVPRSCALLLAMLHSRHPGHEHMHVCEASSGGYTKKANSCEVCLCYQQLFITIIYCWLLGPDTTHVPWITRALAGRNPQGIWHEQGCRSSTQENGCWKCLQGRMGVRAQAGSCRRG